MLVTANIFQPLISVFQHVITFFHSNLGVSWGFSIVLLTISVRLVLTPLAIKQFHSMRKLQHLQPQMKSIQQKYKDDKQRQQEEMMKFYRENEVNPLGSCLPMVAQLPVFISLFYMLRKNLRHDICAPVQARFQAHYALVNHLHVTSSQVLSQTTWCTYYHPHYPGAGFLFINDITNTASGLTLVVLLILYVGTQVMSTLLMSAPTMDKNQRRMMLFLPLVFVLFIIRFPAGLIVYWITTNAWTMGQQYTIKRLMGPVPPTASDAVVDSGPGGGDDSGGGLGALLRRGSPRGGGNGNNGDSSGSAASATRVATKPPAPPRKKKKRSGRRR